MSRPAHIPWLNLPNMLYKKWEVQKLLLPNIFPICNFPFLQSKYTFDHPFSIYVNLNSCSFLTDTKFVTHIKM
jgi:hypothetical protein